MIDVLLWIWENFLSPTSDPHCCFSWLPALIGALGTFGATALGTSMQARANEAAWNKANEYNSIKNQIARYREAGVSPSHVLYGSKSIESTTDQMQVPDYPSAMNAASQAVASAANMALLRQQVKNAKQEGRVLAADAKSKELDNEAKEIRTKVDIDRLLAANDAWIRFDDSGMKIGTLSSEGEFSPMFDSDGTPVLGPEGVSDFKMSYYEGFRDALRNGFAADTEFFNSRISQIEAAIKEEFGRENAVAIISQLKAAAFAANEQGRDLKFDNDFFQNLKVDGVGIGGKSAELLLKTLLRVLNR